MTCFIQSLWNADLAPCVTTVANSTTTITHNKGIIKGFNQSWVSVTIEMLMTVSKVVKLAAVSKIGLDQ